MLVVVGRIVPAWAQRRSAVGHRLNLQQQQDSGQAERALPIGVEAVMEDVAVVPLPEKLVTLSTRCGG